MRPLLSPPRGRGDAAGASQRSPPSWPRRPLAGARPRSLQQTTGRPLQRPPWTRSRPAGPASQSAAGADQPNPDQGRKSISVGNAVRPKFHVGVMSDGSICHRSICHAPLHSVIQGSRCRYPGSTSRHPSSAI